MKKWEAISVRFTKQDLQPILQVCEARGKHLSSFVRRAVLRELASLGFLSQERMKALGMAE